MFEYDRLALDVARHLTAPDQQKQMPFSMPSQLAATATTGGSTGSIDNRSDQSPSPQEENQIAHSLAELLQHRHRSASLQSNNSLLYQQYQQYKSLDYNSEEMGRRFSGGSASYTAGVVGDLFDCGASSGYGSPGIAGTPLASPSANSVFINNHLQRMLLEQNYGSNDRIVHSSRTGLSPSPPTTVAMRSSQTPPLIQLKTTGTGTNKNTNKRKTSLVPRTGDSPVPPVDPIVAAEDGFSMNEVAEFAQLLSSPKRLPPARYVCHICYQPGHYISDCPMRFNSPYEELTPYQGRKKCYGEFQCEQCKRKWTSQNSVANEAQSCIKCHVQVFPHKQLPVDKAVALGLVKAQRVQPLCVSPIGSGRPHQSLSPTLSLVSSAASTPVPTRYSSTATMVL